MSSKSYTRSSVSRFSLYHCALGGFSTSGLKWEKGWGQKVWPFPQHYPHSSTTMLTTLLSSFSSTLMSQNLKEWHFILQHFLLRWPWSSNLCLNGTKGNSMSRVQDLALTVLFGLEENLENLSTQSVNFKLFQTLRVEYFLSCPGIIYSLSI